MYAGRVVEQADVDGALRRAAPSLHAWAAASRCPQRGHGSRRAPRQRSPASCPACSSASRRAAASPTAAAQFAARAVRGDRAAAGRDRPTGHCAGVHLRRSRRGYDGDTPARGRGPARSTSRCTAALFGAQPCARTAVDGVELRPHGGRDAGPGRRVAAAASPPLGALDAAPDRADRRARSASTARDVAQRCTAERAAPLRAQSADHLPGPVRARSTRA